MTCTLLVVYHPAYIALPDIVNGEQNKLAVSIENKSDRNVTLKSISGSFHHPETNALIKNDDKYRVTAYDSIVTVVELPVSILDFKLLTTYAIVTALLGGLAYLAYATFFPQAKKPRKAAVSAPVGTVTATAAGGYQEEWIPEHHIKKSKTGGKKKSGVATSGDEMTSGAESDAIKKRKSKK
ncbi:hypothetical protein HWV62_2246 [Athelia sp. TMB]|nr:hypothetical protein HWV62_2246 [Athelia sp. TMB]